MKITISTTASPDAPRHETLILGFFSDERPPKGYCGLVDWRLNGVISGAMAAERISGSFLEKIAYAFPGRIPFSRLILFGLGPLSELTYDKLYNAGYEMASTAIGIGATDISLPIPAAGRGPLKIPEMAEALFTGVYDGFAREPRNLSAVGIEIPVQAGHANDVLRGVDRFRQQASAAGIEILESGQEKAGETDIQGELDPSEGLGSTGI